MDDYSFTEHNAESIISPVEVTESEITNMSNYGQSIVRLLSLSAYLSEPSHSV
ncbi:hypothetical protein [Jeotgalicoccus sp. WY2]|uniref:hypothetical protein n=1 Tax=Jeotgalicoccus sp. WY2 TaxID=2708346 RepID=UPI001BD2D14D|nr:hypothetical protein [Jeotgalicoccus sp. WY2]